MAISSTVVQLAFLLCVGCVNEYLAQEVDFTNCRGSYEIQPDTVYVFRNPGYPNAYPAGQSCQYNLYTSRGYQITLNCRTDIPATTNCAGNRLDVERSGTTQLDKDQRYCGSQNFITTSNANRLTFSQLSPPFPQGAGGSYYCRAYSQPGCDCGRLKNTRIVGGTTTPVNGNPSAAALIDRRTGARCGASLIDSQWFITAAHCIEQGDVPNYVFRVGDNDLRTPSESRFSADYPPQYCKVHEGYNAETGANDIAVCKTDYVRYNEGVGPICLPWGSRTTNYAGSTATAYGYGATAFGGPSSNVLMQVPLNILTTQQCNAQGANRGYSVTNSQICTYSENRDFCQNDSGGQLSQISPYGFNTLLGIQSYGYACAVGAPGVHTRTTSYLDWISANTPGANYCFNA